MHGAGLSPSCRLLALPQGFGIRSWRLPQLACAGHHFTNMLTEDFGSGCVRDERLLWGDMQGFPKQVL